MNEIHAEKVIVKRGKKKTVFRSNQYVIMAVAENGLVNMVKSVAVGGVEECIYEPATLITMMRRAADKIEMAMRGAIKRKEQAIDLDEILESAEECLAEYGETRADA